MSVTTLVMAGGKGSRMALREEKPLLKVGGKPMIEHVIDALKDAEHIDGIIITVSGHTTRTNKHMKEMSFTTLKTPGRDYVSDLKYAVVKLRLETVMSVSADLPLLTSDIIDRIIEEYLQHNKPALTVVVPLEIKERLGLGTEYALKLGTERFVPAGINVINGKEIDEKELKEDVFVIDDYRVAVNVNTPHDLMIAENLFQKKMNSSFYNRIGARGRVDRC